MTNREDILSLAPCPFCGRDNVTVSGPYGWYNRWCISHSCSSFYCGTSEFAGEFPSKQAAADAWNRRAAPTPPAAEAAPSTPTLSQLREWCAASDWHDHDGCSCTDAELLSLAPTPPAAEAPGQEPVVWRELMQQAADALSIFTGHDSQPNLKHRYGEHWWEPVNTLRDRLIAAVSAPPTYADAEAKGVEPSAGEIGRVKEAIHTLIWEQRSPEAIARAAILAIRSLASPAPKGET